jgi:hypothetical protein
MQVKNHKYYNAKAKIPVDPTDMLCNIFKITESYIKGAVELQPEIETKYIQALMKRLADDVGDIEINLPFLKVEEACKELTILNDNIELRKLITLFVSKYWDLPEDAIVTDGKVEIQNLNYTKSFIRLSYFRVKSFVDVLGDEKGIDLYKEILKKIVDEEVKNADYKRSTQRESAMKAIKRWKETGLGDLTSCIFDDYKVIFRFDRCVIHEALKDYNDPDHAYIATCYRGDVQGAHPGKFFRMRRTQTLHHAPFCDEMYWYEDEHPNAEQPSLEFTKNLGKKKS